LGTLFFEAFADWAGFFVFVGAASSGGAPKLKRLSTTSFPIQKNDFLRNLDDPIA
jgi:hypothetical protein